MKPRPWIALLLAAGLAACASPGSQQVFSGGESVLKLRAAQTRAVESSDRNKVLRAVIATLQDLGFMVSGADAALGAVTGRKFTTDGTGRALDLRMTVTVRPRDDGRMLVRANAEFNNKPVEDPKAYQNFFAALGKSVFLETAEAD